MKLLLTVPILWFALFTNSIKSHPIETENKLFFETKNVAVTFTNTDNKTVYTVKKFNRVMQRVQLNDDFGKNFSLIENENGFIVNGLNQQINFNVLEDSDEFTLIQVSRSVNVSVRVSDCFDLASDKLHWYGGPQIPKQYWPTEKLILENYPYVTHPSGNGSTTERYWLNSKGAFVYVDDRAPLFLNQNINRNTLCFIVENAAPYNTRRELTEFTYFLGFGENAKSAQKKAVDYFLKNPIDAPDFRMVEHPIWSTWAKFKRDINESNVMRFASEIQYHGFQNSQIEIDDDWETCYGALEFSKIKFPNIRNTTDDLHANGFRVTLWIHPFINKGCEPFYSIAKDKNYFVVDHANNSDTKWWNSEKDQAGCIDFTNPSASEWFETRLKQLQEEAGIDSFKFDAGETGWSPNDPKLNAEVEEHPSAYTKSYVRAVAKFGPLVEVRTAHKTQDLPIFLRMFDKNTEWSYDFGLPTLVTTLLQLNMQGYGFILPDMIGGNGYNHPPSKELFIRWLQATVFMPSIQFSYVPWDYDNETIEISKTFTEMHAEHTKTILTAFKKLVVFGEPVNAPIWWLDPYDEVALGINDEFLLGDRILSAPVMHEGNSRHIYLPKGKWFDPNLDKIYTGPFWLMDYPAPLDTLPYFLRLV